jgi:hypothetical protein
VVNGGDAARSPLVVLENHSGLSVLAVEVRPDRCAVGVRVQLRIGWRNAAGGPKVRAWFFVKAELDFNDDIAERTFAVKQQHRHVAGPEDALHAIARRFPIRMSHLHGPAVGNWLALRIVFHWRFEIVLEQEFTFHGHLPASFNREGGNCCETQSDLNEVSDGLLHVNHSLVV